MWGLPTFEVELRLLHLGRVVRTRKIKVTRPMGLRRSVNTALRVAIEGGTGLAGWDAAADAWRCVAVVPRGFAARFGITENGSSLERKGKVFCEGSICEDVRPFVCSRCKRETVEPQAICPGCGLGMAG